MRSMKTLLRLMGAVTLSTVAASSVVACGNAKAPQLNAKYAVLLGWYSNETTSNINQKLSKDQTAGKEKEEITIDKQSITTTNFKTKLLVANNSDPSKFQAKDVDAAKFLADLGFKSGNESQDYSQTDTAAINALKAKITSFEAGKIEANAGKTDFNVGAGTCQISIMDKDGTDAKSIKDYTINTLKKDDVGVPAEVASLVIKDNLALTKDKGYKQGGKVLTSLPWATGKDKEKRLYDSLVKLFGKESLIWASDSNGQNSITTYPTSGKAYLMVKFGNVKLLNNYLDCGDLPGA
ncbi:hypothetical protein [Spiroplasma endosymbiont of Polydrusus pterygomalis]|uniref:hypothetical protein n=1 Tax=Spiroplasma endosymbiont of Polydrusus pterygomalis TaxID=3139327 RepID=UPI003CCAB6D7